MVELEGCSGTAVEGPDARLGIAAAKVRAGFRKIGGPGDGGTMG